jgi:MFS family permease
MRALIADARYRRFFFGALFGDIAIQIQGVAIGWHVFALDHRALDLGLVGLVLFLPTFLLSLPAGVVADRYDRPRIVTFGICTEAAGSFAFLALVAAGERRIAAFLAVLAVIGIARAFTAPAERTLLPSILSTAAFMRGQALYSSARELAVIGGPALGGILVAFGAPVAFGVSGALLVLAAGAFAFLRVDHPVHEGAPPTMGSALEGVRFILNRPIVLGAISLDLFAVLFGGVTAILPIYADSILRVGPVGLGLLRSAPAAGAAVAALWFARRPPERRIGAMLLAAVATFGVATLVFALSRNIVLSLAMLALLGAGDMVSVVIRVGLLRQNTPDAMRGRVNAAENVFIGASNELGAFESGALAALLGTVPSVVVGGLGTLLVVAAWAVLFPQLRTADRLDVPAEAANANRPEAL